MCLATSSILISDLAMAEPMTVILILFGVIVLTAIAFCVWVVATIIRLMARGVSAFLGLGGGSTPPYLAAPKATPWSSVCPRHGCRAANPASARFCRRCGHELMRHAGQRSEQWW
jgi:ribosomal protein L40E